MSRPSLFWMLLLPELAFLAAAAGIISIETASGATKGLLLALLGLAAGLHVVVATRPLARASHSLETTTEELQSSTSETGAVEGHSGEFADFINLPKAVLGTMAEGVVVVDRRQTILFANDASRSLLDMRSEAVVGRPLWEASRLATLRQAVEQVITGGQRHETEYITPRGQLTVAATVTPLPDEPVPGVMLVLRDVTDLRRLETMRRDFVSNVSHELKTPLTSIQAYADTLLEDEATDPEQSRYFLEKIVEQAERLSALIVDIIRLGKIESEPDVFELGPVPVKASVDACLEAHATVAATNGVTLAADTIPTELAVLADAGELRTIFDNLVNNALHYTPRGGLVNVRLVESTLDTDLVGIAVADTGIGISKDQQNRIFERFYRVDRARDRQRGGTGLGLSIVKHLCQLFGGRVEVQSELGVGTTFTVWIPVVRPGGQSASASGNGSGSSR